MHVVWSFSSSACLFVAFLTFTIVNINAIPRAQSPTKEELDLILKETFGTPPPPPPPERGPSDACTCVPYYLCENGTVITDGVGLIDVSLHICFKSSVFEAMLLHRIHTPASINNELELLRRIRNTYNYLVKEDHCPDVLEVCCDAPIEKGKERRPIPIGRQGCGHRNDQGVGFRITGDDNEAQFAEFPWMIGLLEKEDNNLVYKCGGSLIHEQVVLTAAHCVVNRDPKRVDMYARAGEWDTQTTHELYAHQQQKIKQIIIHERYYSAALYYDVALLILEQPFEFADNVDIICLPATPQDHSTSQNCLASGWGKDKFEKGGEYKVILKKVELPMVPHEFCQDKLRTTRLGKYFNLHETFVCAGGNPGLDTCKGDGGSPLICPVEGSPGTYKQVGMVAWGIGCGTDVPGVYVNVPYFRDWIDKHMISNNFRIEYNYAL